jgi:hypothetical protein
MGTSRPLGGRDASGASLRIRILIRKEALGRGVGKNFGPPAR